MIPDKSHNPNPEPHGELVGSDYYTNISNEITRGVEADELISYGHRSPLLTRLASDAVKQTLIAELPTTSEDKKEEPTTLELFRERFDWVPRYEQEINIAVNGLEDTLQGLHIRYVDEIRSNMIGYQKAADNILRTLGLGLVDIADPTSISTRKIRNHVDEFGHRGTKGHHVILDELATELFFADNVLTGNGPWPQRNGEGVISPKRLKPYIAQVNTASNEQLVEMWNKTHQSQALRSRFWAKNLNGKSGNNPHPRINESRLENLPLRPGAYRR